MRKEYLISLFISLFFLCSCHSENSSPAVDELPIKHKRHSSDVQIPFREDDGTKYVQVKINDIPLEAIFDTGCNIGISMSWTELQILVKNGKIAEYDVLGTITAVIADGSEVEALKVRLHKVELNEKLVLEDVEASVDFNMEAPVLLGTGVLDNVSRTYTIDNENKMILFTRK